MSWSQNRPNYGPPNSFPGRPPSQLHHPPPQPWSPPAQGIHNRPPGMPVPLWTEHTNAEGRKYYYNTVTRQSSWDKPEDLMTPEEKALAACPWKEYTTPEGKKYYSHLMTKESKWEMPDEYKAFLEKAKHEKEKAERATPSLQSPNLPPVASTSTGPTPAVPPSHQFPHADAERARQMQMGGPMPSAPVVASSPVVPPAGFSGLPHALPLVAAPAAQVNFATKEEAEEAFLKLLSDSGVRPSWTWEQTMRAIITRPHYRALKTLAERKQAFTKFVEETAKREREEEMEKAKKQRDDYFEMLQTHPEIKSNTRWRKALDILASHPAFLAVPDERQREAWFEEYTSDLRRREKDELRELRRHSMDRFHNLLKSISGITFMTPWAEAQTIYTTLPGFSAEEYKGMDSMDFLSVFEDYVKILDTKYHEDREKWMDSKRRQERRNRDGFKALLEELRTRGVIHAKSKWMDTHPLIKDDERYQNILGLGGSTPLELFWDMLEELDERFYQQKKVVYEVLKDTEFEVTTETSFALFQAHLASDERITVVEPVNLRLVFDHLQAKAAHRLREERRRQEKRLRRKIDACRSVLKRLEPAIVLESTWEEVRPRVEDKMEFKMLDSEEQRVEAFEKYLRRLREKLEERSRHSGAEEGKDEDEEGTIKEEEGELIEDGNSRARKSSQSSGKHSGPGSANGNGSRKYRHRNSGTSSGKHRGRGDSDRESGPESGEEDGDRRKRKKRSHRHGSMSADDVSSAEEGEAFDDDDDYHRPTLRRRHHGGERGERGDRGERSLSGRLSSSSRGEDRKEKRRDVTASTHSLDPAGRRSVSASSKTDNGGANADVEMEEGEAVDDE